MGSQLWRPQIAIAEPSAEVRCAKDPRSVEKSTVGNRTSACRITCDAPFVLPVSAARLRLYNHLKNAPHLHPSVDSARTTEQETLPLCYQTAASRVLRLVQPPLNPFAIQKSEGKSQL